MCPTEVSRGGRSKVIGNDSQEFRVPRDGGEKPFIVDVAGYKEDFGGELGPFTGWVYISGVKNIEHGLSVLATAGKKAGCFSHGNCTYLKPGQEIEIGDLKVKGLPLPSGDDPDFDEDL